jgi:hypothetical protein
VAVVMTQITQILLQPNQVVVAVARQQNAEGQHRAELALLVKDLQAETQMLVVLSETAVVVVEEQQ